MNLKPVGGEIFSAGCQLPRKGVFRTANCAAYGSYVQLSGREMARSFRNGLVVSWSEEWSLPEAAVTHER